MGDVEARAEAEARKKGLSGQAEQHYVGGAFNRIRQAHSAATTPGKGARHLKRQARKEARQEAENRIARHKQQIQREKDLLNAKYPPEKREKTTPRPKQSAIEKLQRRAHPSTTEIAREMAARSPQPPAAPQPKNQRANRPADTRRAAIAETVQRHLAGRHVPQQSDPAIFKRVSQGKGSRADYEFVVGPVSDAQYAEYRAAARTGKRAATPAAKLTPEDRDTARIERELARMRKQPKLVPIKQLPGYQLDATRRLDPYFIEEYFGSKQLKTALSMQTSTNLEEAVQVVEEKTGKKYSGPRTKTAMMRWILANYK